MSKCPCGTGKEYQECCHPYISGEKNAPTAVATMRARYSSFVKVELDYLHKTFLPENREDYDAEETKTWAEKSEWLGLEIVETEAGKEEDSRGTVDFVARFSIDGSEKVHHELAEFKKIDGFWYFADSKMLTSSYKRTAPKVGRNDPCVCGSGKKYKKCCLNK